MSVGDLDGSEFYAFVLPSSVEPPAGILPEPAEFQDSHTLVAWHSPVTQADLLRISSTLRVVQDSLAGTCSLYHLSWFVDLRRSLTRPSTYIAYSYLKAPTTGLSVLELYLFDPSTGAFYMVRFAV
jgi:hypothetical protein